MQVGTARGHRWGRCWNDRDDCEEVDPPLGEDKQREEDYLKQGIRANKKEAYLPFYSTNQRNSWAP